MRGGAASRGRREQAALLALVWFWRLEEEETEETRKTVASTFAPLVVLVIYANIHVVGLMLLSSEFQTSSTMAWQGQGDVEPFKMLRSKIGKASRLYIFD